VDTANSSTDSKCQTEKAKSAATRKSKHERVSPVPGDIERGKGGGVNGSSLAKGAVWSPG